MAAASLLALIDDIAGVLDDVALMTKVAARKTAGVLGDDLALNAQQVSGVRADRELPVVWAVAKGSFRNKLILVPAALLISAVAPRAITPLLMLGGAYLCLEGVEKLAHKFLHPEAEQRAERARSLAALNDPEVDLVAFEQEKIQGAIRTDFVLSAEIIVIALGSAQAAAFATQVMVVAGIALAMTIGVYGLVAGIVKLDDLGMHLLKCRSQRLRCRLARPLGNGILAFAPRLMKTLSVVGTAAMFLVGGGILLHGLPQAHEWMLAAEHAAQSIPAAGAIMAPAMPLLLNALAGVLAGALVLAVVTPARKLISRLRRP